jgi:hypothetical protein
MRRLNIKNITISSTLSVPSIIEIEQDYTSIFHGKEWIDGTGSRSPYYTYDFDTGTAVQTPPTGTVILVASTFEIIDNLKYSGKYTVYTKPSSSSLESSEFISGRTFIRVNEALPAGSGAELTSGVITHISTYLITVTGEQNLLVLEQGSNTSRPIELLGRFNNGWGEVVFQNQVLQAQSFAGTNAPVNPFQGQLWYDTTLDLLKIKRANGWEIVNSAFFGGPPYRHTENAAGTTWVIQHNMNLPLPFIASATFFVDIGSGVYKPILPADVTFTDANTITATFSQAYSGYAVVRN